MNNTHRLARRIAAGIGISLFASVALAATLVPGGALEGRATSLRINEPEVTTTTTVPAVTAPMTEEPVVTTTTTAPIVAPVVVPTTIGQALVITATEPRSGQYACPAGMTAANQYDPGCILIDAADPGPVNANPNNDPALPAAADGDQPGHTLGSTNPAYGDRLTAELCAAKPWIC